MTLEFGQATDAYQALIRLPNRSHPLYSVDPQMEHYVHFSETVWASIGEALLYPANFRNINLEDRLVPLKFSDVAEIEKLTFKRDQDQPILDIKWGSVNPENIWANFLLEADDDYFHWTVTRMTPDIDIPGFHFICIEQSTSIFQESSAERLEETSDFYIGIITDEEFNELVNAFKGV